MRSSTTMAAMILVKPPGDSFRSVCSRYTVCPVDADTTKAESAPSSGLDSANVSSKKRVVTPISTISADKMTTITLFPILFDF